MDGEGEGGGLLQTDQLQAVHSVGDGRGQGIRPCTATRADNGCTRVGSYNRFVSKASATLTPGRRDCFATTTIITIIRMIMTTTVAQQQR